MANGNMNFHFERGIVLIWVILWLIPATYLALFMVDNSWLVNRTVNVFQAQLFGRIEAKNQLLALEPRVKHEPAAYANQRKSFVADHLKFDCQEGIQIYQVETDLLQSFIAIRE